MISDSVMKYGMVIVAVLVVGILLAFVFHSGIANVQRDNSDEVVKIEGSPELIMLKLQQLCDSCLTKKNADCAIVEADASTDIKAGNSRELYVTSDIHKGKTTLKVSRNGTGCSVREI